MRQIHLKCPYCSTEGYVPVDRVRKFVNPDRVKEPVSLPCGPCAAARVNQSLPQPPKNHRFWNWFDRVTRYSLVAKIIVAMTPMTAAVGAIGYKFNLIENYPVTAFIIAILLFCEGMFLLGLFVDVPCGDDCNVISNPVFRDLEGNAWHKREIGQL